GVEISAMEERHPFPELQVDFQKELGEAREEFGSALGFVHQVHDALGVAAEKSVEIGGSEFGGVADGKSPFGRADQRQAELQVFPEPGIVAIESDAASLVQ